MTQPEDSQPEDSQPEDSQPDDRDGHIKPPRDVPAVSAEELVDGELPSEGDGRRYPSTIGGAFYLVVLAVTAVGIGLAATGSWRVGIRTVAGALALSAVTRLVLPAKDAGMLAVRFRWLDALFVLALAGALAFLASSIPEQPGA